MGIFLSKIFDDLFSFLKTDGRETRLLMLGLDAAGKTTILYKLKLNENIVTIPTIGFNVETVNPIKGLTFTIWDVGGQAKIRQLWKHYFRNTEGLFFVVDSSDRERLDEAKEELHGIMADDEMKNVPIVVIANKQDMPGAMRPSEVVDGLDLRSFRSWHVQGACAVNGEGVYEAMDQMARTVKENKSKYGL